jgi:murein L,D-transpeptidase YafK
MLARDVIKNSEKRTIDRPLRLSMRVAMLALSLGGTIACTVPKVPEPVAPAVEASQSTEALTTDVLAETDVTVVVTKHARRLELYRRGTLVRAFPIVLGARPMGAKRFEGDMRTPEGVYRVAAKRLHGRWRYFIAIDYPTADDRSAYDADVYAGLIPQIGGKVPGLGGNLGIHGNDRPRDQASGKDWTRGCVAMRNEDVAVLYDTVDVGTPVIVLP